MKLWLNPFGIIWFVGFMLVGCTGSRFNSAEIDQHIQTAHQQFVFADIHAHPSRFHRDNVPRISKRELQLYQRRHIDVVVCTISADAPYSGGYTERDGTVVPKLPRHTFIKDLKPGTAFTFATDRISRILRTIADGDAVLADHPTTVLEARRHRQIALLPALEGADALEGRIENLYTLHQQGLRLLQLVHFRVNEVGHIQTYPHTPGGLTPFGAQVVQTANELGIIIDLAHANTQTILDVIALSQHPVIFSHTGAKAIQKRNRHLSDSDIQAIAAKDGVIGIWPNGSAVPLMRHMMRHIDHIKALVGVDHIGIGSDLRGVRKYTFGFGHNANFRAIAKALLNRGYTTEEVGKIMGGNFFRVWQAVTAKQPTARLLPRSQPANLTTTARHRTSPQIPGHVPIVQPHRESRVVHPPN